MRDSIFTEESSVVHRQRNKHSFRRRIIFPIFALILVLGTVTVFPMKAVAVTEDRVWNTKPTKGFEVIILSSYRETMKIGQTKLLLAVSSAGKEVKWRSSSSRIASVDPYGIVTAKKAGTCRITAKTGGAEASCTVVVEKTTIALNTKQASIENGAMFQMRATTSTGVPVTWKSSRKSVAIISDDGMVQAIKPGTTIITATAEGSKETCTLKVLKPTIKLSQTSLRLTTTQVVRLRAMVSSGREVTWRSSRTSVATVDEYGQITAVRKGTARISASLDGVTRYCNITVTDGN